MQKWKTLSKKMVLNEHWCKIRKDAVQLPNGKILDDYFVSIRPDVAIIFAVTEDHAALFVRQYRYPVKKTLLELPTGTFDPKKENPKKAIQRELLEETGYRAEKIQKLGVFSDWPTKDTNWIHAFIGTGAKKIREPRPEKGENIECIQIPLQKIQKMVKQNKIQVASSIATISLAIEKLEKREKMIMTKKRVQAVAFLLVKKGHFLVEKRKKTKKFDPGIWTIPGGKIEQNEQPEKAVKREANEELGIKLKRFHFLCSLVSYYSGHSMILHYFTVSKWSGKIQNLEAEKINWTPLFNIKRLKLLTDRQALKIFKTISDKQRKKTCF